VSLRRSSENDAIQYDAILRRLTAQKRKNSHHLSLNHFLPLLFFDRSKKTANTSTTRMTPSMYSEGVHLQEHKASSGSHLQLFLHPHLQAQTLPKALSGYTYSMNPSQLSTNEPEPEPEPEHKRLFELNSQTRLLSLPQELRDAIYDRVLRSRDIINFTHSHRPRGLRKEVKKPALLQVSS
jgi:hypothetical protein